MPVVPGQICESCALAFFSGCVILFGSRLLDSFSLGMRRGRETPFRSRCVHVLRDGSDPFLRLLPVFEMFDWVHGYLLPLQTADSRNVHFRRQPFACAVRLPDAGRLALRPRYRHSTHDFLPNGLLVHTSASGLRCPASAIDSVHTHNAHNRIRSRTWLRQN